MTKAHTFNYRWNLSNGYPAPGIEYHGCKVFSTFACGGGSSMGYKLAGYDHIGGNEIDPAIAAIYEANHYPKYFFQEDIRKLIDADLPEELYQLDVLDGSPPCSSFSIAGRREKDWGKEKKFREGQTEQRLDDLFFKFISLASKLKPKAIIAENVKGLISGNAKSYVKEIMEGFDAAGYDTQLFLLNAASMGVPQRRERVFFICRRKDIQLPALQLSFGEKPIVFYDIEKQISTAIGRPVSDLIAHYWKKTPIGRSLKVVHPKGHFFNSFKIHPYRVLQTIAANDGSRLIHYREPYHLHDDALKLCGSFPMDYNFLNQRAQYLIGMSVPPVMAAQVAYQVYEQWFKQY